MKPDHSRKWTSSLARRFFVRPGFSQQLVGIFTIGVGVLTLISSLATSTLSSRVVREQLIEQGQRATEAFAAQSTLALLYQSAENAQDSARATSAFPGVLAVAVYDIKHNALLSNGQLDLLAVQPRAWPTRSQMDLEDQRAWYFIAPVYARGHESTKEQSPLVSDAQRAELLGFVRVVLGKETLQETERRILTTNLYVSTVLAAFLLFVLLYLTRRVTTPIKELAISMRRAATGRTPIRAKLSGPRDIIQMERAFNWMMDALEAREKQLKQAHDAALELARVKGEFAATVSHELRTPLNGVIGMLELLEDMELAPQQKEYVHVANDAAESLLALIDDILDFSKLDSGKITASTDIFRLPDLLNAVTGLLSGQATRKGLDLSCTIAAGMPAQVCGDAKKLRQILINLIGNAIKFTNVGGVQIRITNQLQDGKKLTLRFEVQDTGIGISPEKHATIFEAFVQADSSTTRQFGGTGLGLAIARQLVEFMGGEIGVASDLGHGSTFWFTICVELVDSDRQNLLTGQVVSLHNQDSILVAAPDGDTRIAILNGLTDMGLHAEQCVSSVDEAIGVIAQNSSDAEGYGHLIVDEDLPGGGAASLIDTLSKSKNILPRHFAVITEADNRTGSLDSKQFEITYIRKPLNSSTLSEALLLARDKPFSLEHQASAITDDGLTTPIVSVRILVVEDNRASQQVAFGMLRRLGYSVDIASNGKEAMEYCSRRSYGLVLMDCRMPVMDGYEATRRIRALEAGQSHTPIIAMTANVQDTDIDECYSAGMDDYIAKPLKYGLLKNQIAKWMGDEKVEGHTEKGTKYEKSVTDETQVLNIEAIEELKRTIGDSVSRMIEMFLEDTPMYLRSLRNAIAANDFQIIADVAHAIKGGARNFGADRVSLAASQLEHAARSQHSDKCENDYKLLTLEYEELKGLLERENDTSLLVSDTPQDPPLILIVDDDRGMRLALRNALAHQGYAIEEASNGVHALALAERKMPDLILMDGLMPVMDGFTACARIRELQAGTETPILIITSLEDEESIDKAFVSGATDYIPKPVNLAVLRQRIGRLLSAVQAERHVRELAYHDPLTGLPNRALFQEHVEQLLDNPRNPKLTHALLFIDLDRFKIVNDTMGHEVGDLLLKGVAQRLRSGVRTSDLVARLGGDEFTVLLQNVETAETAMVVAKKIHDRFRKPFALLGQQIHLGASIGISVFPDHGNDYGTLLKRADMAMFRAKERRGGSCLYDDKMELTISGQLELENDLRRAIDRNELSLHYQPQIDLRSGKIIGVEALLRWQHSELGLISPARFIPIAEESGQIIQIGQWVIRTACEQIKKWEKQGLPLTRVAVNVSAQQLHTADFDRVVTEALRTTGVESRYLELEVTESAVMEDPDYALNMLTRLRATGLRISIDDFGTGYSSMNQLKNFPFNKMKIDQSFVRNITSDPHDAAITTTIISMAENLKLGVIAEGVETEGQVRYLEQLGCHEMQGYFFSKPLPAGEIDAVIRERANWLSGLASPENLPTVLILDDDREALKILSLQLADKDYEVVTVDTPRAAFELLAARRIGVIISDQRMPEMSGTEFLSRVRTLYPTTIRMMLTGNTNLDILAQAVNEGAIYKFITKPWDRNYLREQVSEAIKAASLQVH